jgi:hypothetical protein
MYKFHCELNEEMKKLLPILVTIVNLSKITFEIMLLIFSIIQLPPIGAKI